MSEPRSRSVTAWNVNQTRGKASRLFVLVVCWIVSFAIWELAKSFHATSVASINSATSTTREKIEQRIVRNETVTSTVANTLIAEPQYHALSLGPNASMPTTLHNETADDNFSDSQRNQSGIHAVMFSKYPAPIVSEDDIRQAHMFVENRKSAYNTLQLDYRWQLRGVGYLYTTLRMVLLATLAPSNPFVGRKQRIVIQNVFNQTYTQTECEKLTLWVRVNGPEIFAGAAQAVQPTSGTSCYWTFEYDLNVPGSYSVDVKVLLWNGQAPIGGTQDGQCDASEGAPTSSTVQQFGPRHDGFQGFKMYSVTPMCCEVCTRTPYCQYWSTPFQRLPEPSRFINGCELFFGPDAPDTVIPKSHLWPPLNSSRTLPPLRYRRRTSQIVARHGRPHTNPTSYFLGCGWSFWFTLDFPCVNADSDDRVFTMQPTFIASLPLAENTAIPVKTPTDDLPLCTQADEQFTDVPNGRWVREFWPDTESCPQPMIIVAPKRKEFPIVASDPAYPHCWHREDMTKIGVSCTEMNCRFLNQTSIWKSSLHQETRFNGVWRPYSCRYLEFTDEELQNCMSERKIATIRSEGFSVAEYIQEFVDHRLRNITLYNDTRDPTAMNVVYDTLSLLHHNGPDGHMPEAVAKKSNVSYNEEHYWVTGFFLSSEREVHTHVSRMDRYNRLLSQLIEPKGLKMINAFDMTAAFTYDSATQMDGMHMIGPPMKMLVTKLFHHLCSGIVPGSTV